MRIFRIIAACLAFVPAEVLAAKSTLLQSLDLAGMSTEGGEARLYRVGEGKSRVCRIDVTHYGETGKTTLTFTFASKLIHAAKIDFRYSLPIYEDPKARIDRIEKLTLASRQGRKILAKDFLTYKGLFGGRNLSKCLRR